jgi:predicted RNase H-like nuclease
METLKTYTFDIKTLKRKTKKQQVIEKIDMETQKAQKKIKNKELDLEEAQKLIDSIICK